MRSPFQCDHAQHSDARMYIYNRSGHFSYREHPAEFNEMLRSFICRNT